MIRNNYYNNTKYSSAQNSKVKSRNFFFFFTSLTQGRAHAGRQGGRVVGNAFGRIISGKRKLHRPKKKFAIALHPKRQRCLWRIPSDPLELWHMYLLALLTCFLLCSSLRSVLFFPLCYVLSLPLWLMNRPISLAPCSFVPNSSHWQVYALFHPPHSVP